MNKIGLTFGGGGTKGFAHVPILEVFDELGIKPYCITGTSIGSIMGARYAIFHTYDIVQDSIATAKREAYSVDIYLRPPLMDIGLLDFHKAWDIYHQALKAKDDFKRQLEQLLER